MRIVLDTNQLFLFLDKMNPTDADRAVTLTPYVFAEALLHRDPQRLVDRLQSFDVLLGHEPSDVLAAVAGLDQEGIFAFRPYNAAFTLPATVTRGDLKTAQNIKQRHRAFGATMFDLAKIVRKLLKDANITHKFSDFSETIELLEPSFFQSFVLSSVTDRNSRTLMVCDERNLYVAVMRNRYLARYFRAIFYYIISYSRMWKDQTRNFDSRATRDDWTDITLPLYAADGDIILTADKKLQAAVRTVECPFEVHLKTLDEI
jgi:hypothetical protein